MAGVFYIIESPTLGTLRELDFDWQGKPKPHYSVTGSRSNSETAQQYRTVEDATLTRDMIRGAKARGHKSLNIVRSGDWRYQCEHCKHWVEWSPFGGHDTECPVYKDWLRSHGV